MLPTCGSARYGVLKYAIRTLMITQDFTGRHARGPGQSRKRHRVRHYVLRVDCTAAGPGIASRHVRISR
eukprot:274748-Prymnesium_polylepis.1